MPCRSRGSGGCASAHGTGGGTGRGEGECCVLWDEGRRYASVILSYIILYYIILYYLILSHLLAYTTRKITCDCRPLLGAKSTLVGENGGGCVRQDEKHSKSNALHNGNLHNRCARQLLPNSTSRSIPPLHELDNLSVLGLGPRSLYHRGLLRSGIRPSIRSTRRLCLIRGHRGIRLREILNLGAC